MKPLEYLYIMTQGLIALYYLVVVRLVRLLSFVARAIVGILACMDLLAWFACLLHLNMRYGPVYRPSVMQICNLCLPGGVYVMSLLLSQV